MGRVVSGPDTTCAASVRIDKAVYAICRKRSVEVKRQIDVA